MDQESVQCIDRPCGAKLKVYTTAVRFRPGAAAVPGQAERGRLRRGERGQPHERKQRPYWGEVARLRKGGELYRSEERCLERAELGGRRAVQSGARAAGKGEREKQC